MSAHTCASLGVRCRVTVRAVKVRNLCTCSFIMHGLQTHKGTTPHAHSHTHTYKTRCKHVCAFLLICVHLESKSDMPTYVLTCVQNFEFMRPGSNTDACAILGAMQVGID